MDVKGEKTCSIVEKAHLEGTEFAVTGCALGRQLMCRLQELTAAASLQYGPNSSTLTNCIATSNSLLPYTIVN